MYLTVTAINAAEIVMNKYMNTYIYHQNVLKKKKKILFTDSEDERNAFIEFDRLLTGSAVVARGVAAGAGCCLVGFVWIVDCFFFFFNWPIGLSVAWILSVGGRTIIVFHQNRYFVFSCLLRAVLLSQSVMK